MRLRDLFNSSLEAFVIVTDLFPAPNSFFPRHGKAVIGLLRGEPTLALQHITEVAGAWVDDVTIQLLTPEHVLSAAWHEERGLMLHLLAPTTALLLTLASPAEQSKYESWRAACNRYAQDVLSLRSTAPYALADDVAPSPAPGWVRWHAPPPADAPGDGGGTGQPWAGTASHAMPARPLTYSAPNPSRSGMYTPFPPTASASTPPVTGTIRTNAGGPRRLPSAAEVPMPSAGAPVAHHAPPSQVHGRARSSSNDEHPPNIGDGTPGRMPSPSPAAMTQLEPLSRLLSMSTTSKADRHGLSRRDYRKMLIMQHMIASSDSYVSGGVLTPAATAAAMSAGFTAADIAAVLGAAPTNAGAAQLPSQGTVESATLLPFAPLSAPANVSPNRNSLGLLLDPPLPHDSIDETSLDALAGFTISDSLPVGPGLLDNEPRA